MVDQSECPSPSRQQPECEEWSEYYADNLDVQNQRCLGGDQQVQQRVPGYHSDLARPVAVADHCQGVPP